MAYLTLQQDWRAPAQLASSFFSSVAAHLQDALSVPTSDVARGLESELSAVISRVLKEADPQAIAAAQGRLQEGPIADAFAMGQLSFAQQLASQAVNTGVDQAFLDALKASKFTLYLNALYECERTSKELKSMIGQTDENISRLMRELRDLGITEFRKDGTLVYNFLTPVARQVITAERQAADDLMAKTYSDLQPGVDALLECMRRGSADYMRNQATFEPVAHE